LLFSLLNREAITHDSPKPSSACHPTHNILATGKDSVMPVPAYGQSLECWVIEAEMIPSRKLFIQNNIAGFFGEWYGRTQ